MDALAPAPSLGRFSEPPADEVCRSVLDSLRRLGLEDQQLAQWEPESGRRGLTNLISRCLREGLIREHQYHHLLANVASLTVRSTIAPEEVDERFTQRIPISYARQHGIIGLSPVDGYMPVVTADPSEMGVLGHVGAVLKTPTMLELAPAAVVTKAINEAYAQRDSDFSEVLDGVPLPSDVNDDVAVWEDGDLLDSGSRAPVIKLVNMLLFEAVKRRASDVHVHPLSDDVQIRYRIDGVLYDYLRVPLGLLDELISRVKVIGKMDIAEKRLAQDGRTTVTVGDRCIDLRISIIPTCYGERAVLRLLDKSIRLYELGELGMSAGDRSSFEELIQRQHGVILVTGPTGSGKSTTLYAALQYLDCTEKNILTLEDPIEYQLSGISQTQVSSKKGMTFATGLRAVLRQDPDIIMVGEIRDEETARMAVQSSLTGHLVFSTLHTNNAAGAVSRLVDLGVEPYLVASSLLASLAQRLIRVVCPLCSREESLSNEAIRRLGLDAFVEGMSVRAAVGCEECAMTGYSGRRGIFELLTVDEGIRELVVQQAKSGTIERRARANGMTTLRQDAIRKLHEGLTTVEEVARVTHDEGLNEDGESPVKSTSYSN